MVSILQMNGLKDSLIYIDIKKGCTTTKGVIHYMENYSIEILDKSGKKIGELPTASPTEILQFINKGFVVMDRMSGQQLTENQMSSIIGISEGLINVG